jgi:CxxC-x17-CxxC domain-containing protein
MERTSIRLRRACDTHDDECNAGFEASVYGAAIEQPVRPKQGLHNGTWVAALDLPDAPAASRLPKWPPERPGHDRARGENVFVTYVDRTLTCVDCVVVFIHSAADQEYYVQKGFASDPKRCASCRASRRATREAGYDVRDIGGPRGYERGDDHVAREYFAVICSSCGNQAQVPFKPRMDRPVYCSDCFRQVKPD